MSSKSDSLDRYTTIINRISRACTISNRSINEINLIGVSKGQNLDMIFKFIELGLLNIGESYFQEAVQKIPLLSETYPEVKKHFIGHLQTNKVKKVLQLFDYIHSVDSLKLVDELHKRIIQLTEEVIPITVPYPVFVEVNASGDLSKTGCSIDETFQILEKITDYSPYITGIGLMTIAPFEISETDLRSFYKSFYSHYQKVLYSFPECKFLSAGMSDDFEIAIEYGSTHIRIGTSLFGQRL